MQVATFSGRQLRDLSGGVAGGPGAAAVQRGCSRRGKVLSTASKGWLVVVCSLLVVRVLTRHRRWVLRSSVSEGGGQ